MKKFLIYLTATLLVLTLLFFGGKLWFKANSKVYNGNAVIFEGASVKQVATVLEANDIIKNADVFYYYIVLKQKYIEYAPWSDTSFEVSFKSGNFDIKAASFDEVIEFLNEADNAKIDNSSLTTIPEGSSMDDIAVILAKNNIITEEAFFKKANDRAYYETLREKYLWLPEFNDKKLYQLEGYLHANSYNFEPNSLPTTIIEQLLEQTDDYYAKNKAAILDSDFTFEEIITLASVVEKESKFSADRPKVAQVFINRLKVGMKLESDITANYGSDEHKIFMTYKDISVDSPYNTYKVPSLPIGPISSPSVESLNAILKPEGKDFKALFFYARPSGETFYSNTWEEHDKVRMQYEQEWLDLLH